MDVVIVGGHGKVARRLARLLVARGDRVRGVIRNPAHVDDLRADGSEPVVCDVERAAAEALAGAIRGADAVIFAAGAGPGSGAERKLTIDRDGAIKVLHAARTADVERYVMVSSVGAEDPPDGDDVFAVYLRAKAEADRQLIASDRAWTVVRPVWLQDEQGTGRVRLAEEPLQGEVPRDDVAAVLAAVLHEPRSARRVLYVSAGDDPIEKALARVLGARRPYPPRRLSAAPRASLGEHRPSERHRSHRSCLRRRAPEPRHPRLRAAAVSLLADEDDQQEEPCRHFKTSRFGAARRWSMPTAT